MKRDALTPDLFDVPQPAAVSAGYDFRVEVSTVLGSMLEQARLDGAKRDVVAARVSQVARRDVSAAMLNNYTSPAHSTFNLPFYLVPAVEHACNSHALTNWLAEKRGAQMLVGNDVLNAELGRLELMRDAAAQRARELRRAMRKLP